MSKAKLCVGCSIAMCILIIVLLGVGCRRHWWGGNIAWCAETTTLAEDLGKQMKNTSNLLIAEAGNLVLALLEEEPRTDKVLLSQYQIQLLQQILHSSLPPAWNRTRCDPNGKCHASPADLENFCSNEHPFIFKN